MMKTYYHGGKYGENIKIIKDFLESSETKAFIVPLETVSIGVYYSMRMTAKRNNFPVTTTTKHGVLYLIRK